MDKKQILEVIEKHKNQSPETYNDVINLTKPFYTFHKNMFYGKCKVHEDKYDLLNSEFDVLATLRFSENLSLYAKQISEQLLFSSGGITKVIRKLESKEYIVSIEGKFDKRKKLIKLTKAGQMIFEKVMKDIFEYEEKCFDKLNNDEKGQLQHLLLKLID